MKTLHFRDLKPCSFNPSRYLVSSEGLIWSKRSNKFLKMSKCKQGYQRLILHDDKVKKNFKVHRLVAEAFISNPDNKPEVNHIDGRKDNNFWTNLEWVTPQENTTHAIEAGIHNNRGSKNGSARFTEEEARVLKFSQESKEVLAIKYNTTVSYINAIRKGYRWRHIK